MKQLRSECRPIRRDDLQLFESIPGVIAIARDQNLRAIWCTQSYFKMAFEDESVGEMSGSELGAMITGTAVQEREAVLREVLQSGKVRNLIYLAADRRVLATVFPLDEHSFGHRGIMGVITDATCDAMIIGSERKIELLPIPHLEALRVLTTRELEVLHYVAQGKSTNEIAAKLVRSSKTIEKQINSIHSKLKTHSRAELVRFGTERGIQSFSSGEWSAIVESAKVVRREDAPEHP